MEKSIKDSPINNSVKKSSGKKLVQVTLPFKKLSSPAFCRTPVQEKNHQEQQNKNATKISGTTKDVRKRKLSTETDLPVSKILCSSEIKDSCSTRDAIFISDDESVDRDSEEIVNCDDDYEVAVDKTGEIQLPKTPTNLKNDIVLNSRASRSKDSSFTIKLPISNKRRRNLSQKLEKSVKKNVKIVSSEKETLVKKFKVYSEEARDGKDSIEIDAMAEVKDNEATLSDDICLQVTVSQDSSKDSKRKEIFEKYSDDKETKPASFSYFKISEGFKVPDLKTTCNNSIEENLKEATTALNREENIKEKDYEFEINDTHKSIEIVERSDNLTESDGVEDGCIIANNPEESAHFDDKQKMEIDCMDESGEDDDKEPHTPSQSSARKQKLCKTLTPKQLQKQKQKEEEKLEKQKEKEEKERLRRKEKEEKEELRRKEKEEKEQQKRKEKEERERKKLAEIEAKTEERRQKEEERKKKEELKEEERRKKEEERKRRDQEKEEAENKKKKAAEAFTKFFVQKSVSKKDSEEDQNSVDSEKFKNSTFMPFQVKDHMKLAPILRRTLRNASKENLDKRLDEQLTVEKDLYLNCLKSRQICPAKDTKTWLPSDENMRDCFVIEDELEGAGQAIVEVNKPIQKYRAKFLYFHENQRPPYYGTWRKRSTNVKPRRPLALDKIFFDYEIDSDDEWEEEEPGESLHGSDDEKESEDEYEVDNEFFVPHGHLSDEELQNEDELSDENTPEMQKAKLKILQLQFAQEMKKKTEKINPRLVGPIWQDENGNQPAQCTDKIWQSLNKRAMILVESPLTIELEKIEVNNLPASQEKKTIKKAQLSENQITDLIRLVHGNRHNKKFMIKEFQEFLIKQMSPAEIASVEYKKSTIREQIEKIAQWKVIEDSIKKKKRLCWLVLPDVLKQYNMEDLSDYNKWEYILKPKSYLSTFSVTENTDKANQIDKTSISNLRGENEAASHIRKKKKKKNSSITKFTTSVLKNIDKTQIVKDKEATQAIENAKIESSQVEKNVNSNSNIEMVKCENDLPPDLVESKCVEVKPSVSVKKRVPLLMSVPRGQTIPESTKNTLISDFLKKNSDTINKNPSSSSLIGSSKSIQSMEIETIVIE